MKPNRKHIIRNLRNKGIEFDPDLSTKDLNGLLSQSTSPERSRGGASIVNKISRITNFGAGHGKITVSFNAQTPDEPVQIMVCEDIGKDAWSGEGFALKDLQAALESVDRQRNLEFLIDSHGGYVSAGMSIRNWLSSWGGVINQTIIGVAASAASWCIPADTTRAFKNSQIFTHRAMAAPFGNADDLKDAITQLEKTDNQIADMLAEQSGSTREEMLDLMKGPNGQGTLLTGEEAMACGLVDEVIDGEAKNNFSADWLNSAREKLAALNSLRTQPGGLGHTISAPPQGADQPPTNKPQDTIMNKTEMLALLNKWGVTIPENATDDQLKKLVEAGKPVAAPATPAPAPTNAQPQGLSVEDKAALQNFRSQLENNRRTAIRNELTMLAGAAGGHRIPINQIEEWEGEALKSTDDPVHGNPIINQLKKLPATIPGVPPIPESLNRLEVEKADFKDIRHGFEAHNEATKSLLKGNAVPMKEISAQSIAKARFFNKFRGRFMEMLNTNTIDAGLQRQLILQDIVIRDFKRRIMPLDMFSTVFRNVPLEGTDIVEVPYYDLDTAASQAFAGTYAGMVTNTTSGVRPITVGWGSAHNGALLLGHCRLVQALSFDSHAIATQPYLKIAQLAGLKAEKLAYDIFRDVLSVVKVANYSTLLDSDKSISCPYNLFTSDSLADLKVLCKTWPEMGRGLMIDSAYDGNLMKDPTFKAAYQAAFDSVKTQGKLTPELYGFGYNENPNIPDNSISLRGIAFWKFAILVAFAPVPPVEEVRRAGTTWELITDPDGGASLEYRTFGSNDADTATHVIESSYGFAPGLTTGIKAIVTP